MRRAVVLLLLVAVACGTSGCREETSSAAALDTSELTGAELGWIRAYSKWTFGFYDDEVDVGPDAVAACRDEVEKIGPPPTTRFDEAARSLPPICPLLGRLGGVRRAQDGVERVDDLLAAFFRDEQPIQLRSGVTDRSRADVVFSGIASDVIGHPVEVRCWDEDEWARVVSEDNAWNDESDDPDDFIGWTDDSSDRIHLTLFVCNTLSDVQRSDVATWRRHERIDAANSIETLLHEIGHFLASEASEAEVECTAIGSLPRFLGRFGVTNADARELTELYRTEVYPTLDDEYTEGGCPRKS